MLIPEEVFLNRYAERSGVSIKALARYTVAVPASLDRGECDYEGCEGWHMLPRSLYTQVDVDTGFISQELLDWMGTH